MKVTRGAVILLAATLAITLVPTECARILAINPFPSKSHMVVFTALIKELAQRGHEVVMVSVYPLTTNIANFTNIDILPALSKQYDQMLGGGLYSMNDKSIFEIPLVLWSMGLGATEAVLKMPEMRELANDKRGFDLVIVEAFMNEAVYGFADHFKAPLVAICPFFGFHFINYGAGNPMPMSYVPNGMLSYSDHMTFPQRFFNAFFSLLWDAGNELYYLPRQEKIRKEFFGDDKPSVWKLRTSMSITLLNSHFSLNYPRPLVPAIVEVGGLHVSQKVNKLPEDIQKFMDEAEDGVIYFSMGSNLRSDLLPEESRKALMDAFSELPQRVLFKWESDTMPGQPKNVKFGKWLPQQGILAHPNLQLFITHGGLLSTQEAMFHGVPLVGIPVFGDQSLNMRKAELAGFGVTVNLKNITKQSMVWAINKALQPSYRLEARRRSAVVRDQPESPMDRAVFWTEYVIRHKGAPHLRSAALDLAWYQLYLLDVAAAILVTLLLIFFTLRGALRLCCGDAKKQDKDKKQK